MARLRIVWSLEAKEELCRILQYYNKITGNKKFSKKLNRMIQSSLKLVSLYPYMYRATAVKDTRVFVCEYFKIYYSLNADFIYVEAVFGSRQNPTKDFFYQ